MGKQRGLEQREGGFENRNRMSLKEGHSLELQKKRKHIFSILKVFYRPTFVKV